MMDKKINFSNNIYEIIFLSFAYLKKLFSFKNIIMFLITFFFFWSFYDSIIRISEHNYALDPENHNIIVDRWRMAIEIYGIYFTFLINYSYIFLKKNNFNQFSENKNTISNIIVTSIFFLLLWSFFLIAMIIKMIPYHNQNGNYDWSVMIYLIILMISINIISLLFLSLINPNIKNTEKFAIYNYTFVIVVVVLQCIFFIWTEKIFSLDANETLDTFNLLSIIFLSTLSMLFILNILERLILRNVFFVKDKNYILIKENRERERERVSK